MGKVLGLSYGIYDGVAHGVPDGPGAGFITLFFPRSSCQNMSRVEVYMYRLRVNVLQK